ncbi:hypothetical protein Tco_0468760 [Tanacetum coccineum]
MEEYKRIQEKKALSQGETFNWQTSTYGKMEYYEVEDDCFTNFKTKFPAIVLDNTLTSDAAISCRTPDNKNKIDIERPSGDMYVTPIPDVINVNAQGSNKLSNTSHDTSNKFFKTETFIKKLNVNIMACNYLNNGMLLKNLNNMAYPRVWDTAY